MCLAVLSQIGAGRGLFAQADRHRLAKRLSWFNPSTAHQCLCRLGGCFQPPGEFRELPVNSRNEHRHACEVARSAGRGAAVAWLESGVHIKAVADLLGHSSIAITGDVYGHTSDDTARAAVDGLAGRLGL